MVWQVGYYADDAVFDSSDGFMRQVTVHTKDDASKQLTSSEYNNNSESQLG